MPAVTSANLANAIVKLVAVDALPALMGNLVMGNLVNRDFEPTLGQAGDTVNVPIPPVLVANNLAEGGTVQAQNPSLGNAQIVLNTHAEATFQIPDVGEADYRTDYEYGQIILAGAFGRGYRNVCVEYNAGYTTIPPTLQLLASEMVKLAFDTGKHDASLKSETLGDYSWTAGGSVIIDPNLITSAPIQRRLAPFKNNPV